MGKIKVDRFNIMPFGTEVLVLVGRTVPELLVYWNENLIPRHFENPEDEIGTNAAFMTVTDDEGLKCRALLLSKGIDDAIVLHECFHLVMEECDSKGCKWSKESDEFYAHMLKQVFRDVMKIYKSK